MLKLHSYAITCEEIPDEITLCLNISGCPYHCSDCHSSYLWEDVGSPLTFEHLCGIVEPYRNYISCICFMGGDQDIGALKDLLVRCTYSFGHESGIRLAVYSGIEQTDGHFNAFTEAVCPFVKYLKTGRYRKELGPLSSKTTNQKMFRLSTVIDPANPRYDNIVIEDITHRFQMEKI